MLFMNYLSRAPYNFNIANSTFSRNFRKYLQFKVHCQFLWRWHCYTDGTFTTGVNNTSGLISHEIYIDWIDLIVNLPPVSLRLGNKVGSYHPIKNNNKIISLDNITFGHSILNRTDEFDEHLPYMIM
jgi:hypothetical protein